MLKKRITYWYMRTAAKLGHKFSSNWYEILGKFERPTRKQMNVLTIPIEKKIDAPEQVVLPVDIMDAFIDKASCVGIIHKCTCRTSGSCQEYPHDIGCVVLGSTVETLDPSIGRIVTKDEAKAHARKSLDLGLFPLISHYTRDAQMYSLEYEKMLALCFCCTCCCSIRNTVPHTDGLAESFYENTNKLPAVTVEFDESKCTTCKKCLDVCFANAITFEDGKIKLDQDKCKGCGRCALICDAYSVQYNTADVDKIISQLDISSDIG